MTSTKFLVARDLGPLQQHLPYEKPNQNLPYPFIEPVIEMSQTRIAILSSFFTSE